MRKAFLIVFGLMLLLPTLVSAKPKKKTYGNAPQDVFNAALKTARDRHVVTFVDQANMLFTFSTGQSAFSSGFIANATVEPAAAPSRSTCRKKTAAAWPLTPATAWPINFSSRSRRNSPVNPPSPPPSSPLPRPSRFPTK